MVNVCNIYVYILNIGMQDKLQSIKIFFFYNILMIKYNDINERYGKCK